MAITSNDTDLMRSTADVFSQNSAAFTQESGDIKSTLSAISNALETVVENFNTHNSNVAGYASALSKATNQMQGIWESGAATAFQESFEKFNGSMVNLSQILSDISGKFSSIRNQIEDLVNNNILTQVEAYANDCGATCGLLTNYANTEDENQARLEAAFGH